MHLQTFVGWHSEIPLDEEHIRDRHDRVAQYFQTSAARPLTREEATHPHVGFLSLTPGRGALKFDMVQTTAGTVAAAAHLPFGITTFTDDRRICEGLDIAQLARRLRIDPHAVLALSPPQIVFLYERQQAELFIANDSLGFGRLYEYTAGPLSIWSNRMSAAVLFAGRVPQQDSAAWGTYATMGWFLETSAPFAGVRLVPGGTRVSAWNSAEPPAIETHDGLLKSRFAAAVEGEAPTAEAAAASLVRTFQEVGRFTDSALRVGLSGGRDSRMVAAAAVRSGIEVSLFTVHPPAFEKEIAQQLVDRTPEVAWQLEDRAAVRYNQINAGHRSRELAVDEIDAILSRRGEFVHRSDNEMLQRALANHVVYDGDARPNILYRHLVPVVKPATGFRVSGAAGEFAHPNFYTAASAPSGGLPPSPSCDFAQRFLAGFPSAMAKAATTEAVGRILAEAEDYGIRGLRVFDYFYIFGRFTRWAEGNWGVETVSPLLAPEIMLCAFSQGLERRFSSEFQREIVRAIIPAWADVPYGHELADERPVPQRPNHVLHGYFWDGPDLQNFLSVLAEDELYGDAFDVDAAKCAYARLFVTPLERRGILQIFSLRIAARAAFTLHCDGLARHLPAPTRGC